MTSSEEQIAVYTGSFDPITLGHLNVIERGRRLFAKIVVGVGTNVDKHSLFNQQERMDLIEKTTCQWDNVEVRSFDGLAVTFVRQCNARTMLRGIRPLTDLAGEFTMMMANRKLDDDIETIFLMADGDLSHVSSSLIKQITPLASNQRLAKFVPQAIIPDLRAKLAGPPD